MVEHSVHTRSVICSSQIAATRPVGQAVKTPPFHGGNMGSIPVRVTKKRNHPIGWFLFCYPYVRANPSGSTTSILPSPDGRDALHRGFWQSQKKMRRGTKAAAPPEYSRTDLLLIQRFTWHKTIQSDGFFFVIRMSERTHRVRPQAFCHRQMAAMHCIAAFGKAKRKCAVARRRQRRRSIPVQICC